MFSLTHREAESPRGKINLIRSLLDEKIDPDREAVDIFNRCLLCYACQDACPAGVKTEKIWISAREILADEVGRPLGKSIFLRRIMTQPRLWGTALALGRRWPGSSDSVNLSSFKLPRPSMDRLDRIMPEVLEPEGQLVGAVVFFPGCLLSEVFPHLGLRTAKLLSYLGYRVIMPRDRVCCGAPAFNNGDLETARRLAEKNLEVLSSFDVDAVISPDATCGGAFHHEYEMLFPHGSGWRKAYVEFREQVQDYGEFILKVFSSRKGIRFKPLSRKVTVHDSCHLSHLQHKSDIPRKLLAFIPELKIVESPRSDLCCGFGGSYSVLFSAESKAIARRKLEYLQAPDANTVVVGSPGCLWKLRSEAADLALNIGIVHYIELIWESLIGEDLFTPDNVFENAESMGE